MIKRRNMVTGVVGGLLFGVSGLVLTRGDASIRFIGRNNTIIALLDTETERVLIVLGARDDDLLKNTVGLTTIGNARIDLVVASYSILSSRLARSQLNTDITPTLALLSRTDLPPIQGNIMNIAQSARLKLGANTTFHIEILGNSETHPDFLITIKYRDTQIVMASAEPALRLHQGQNPHVLVIPGSAEDIATLRMNPQLLVTNVTSPSLAIPQIEVFPADPVAITLGDNSVTVRDNQLSS